jgi:hypothetical protein
MTTPITTQPEAAGLNPNLASAEQTPAWELTRAVYLLRLSVADACLRAREEARLSRRASAEYWSALGRAHGFQRAAEALRTWIRPDLQHPAIAQLEQLIARVRSNPTPTSVFDADANSAFYTSYSWAIEWVLSQIRELRATHMPGHYHE